MPSTRECDIVSFFHCATCLPQVPKGVSPAEWSSQQAGWTRYGMQVWCNRCDKEIIAIDFERVAELLNEEKKDE